MFSSAGLSYLVGVVEVAGSLDCDSFLCVETVASDQVVLFASCIRG